MGADTTTIYQRAARADEATLTRMPAAEFAAVCAEHKRRSASGQIGDRPDPVLGARLERAARIRADHSET